MVASEIVPATSRCLLKYNFTGFAATDSLLEQAREVLETTQADLRVTEKKIQKIKHMK